MLCIASLQQTTTNTTNRPQEHGASIPKRTTATRPTLMAIQPDEWLQGPQGLTSLGEMLEVA
eukprot:11932500-Karenia_brevis.AAC.1